AYGSPATTPTQDMILGMYYLTIEKHDSKGEGKLFSSIDEAMLAYDAGVVELQAPIRVQIFDQLVRCTVGRLFMWNAVPENIKVHSIEPLDGCKLGKGPVCFREINRTFVKKDVVRFVKRVHTAHGNTRTASFLDNLKALGYKFATRSGTTISVTDIKIPPEKPAILEHADSLVQKTDAYLRRGLLTEEEHYHQLMKIWGEATDEVEAAMMRHLDRLNPVFMMATSGARGNPAQVKQLAGMRGLMADPTGRIIPLPIRANLREGLTVLEYFIGTHGARKGLADTALRTADSGYLTRRLIDVSQDIIVRMSDCGCTRGTRLEPAVNNNAIKEGLAERLVGRYLVNDLEYEDREGNKCFISKDEMIDDERSVEIEAWLSRDMNSKGFIPEEGVPEQRWKRPGIEVRSVLTCRATQGVCAKCYGKDLATGKQVEIGATVGIVAAQSIGEPGTQLTLRTFHTGGVAQDDIIQGLPRVEELFEARKPKNKGEMAGIDGVVELSEDKGMLLVTINGGTVVVPKDEAKDGAEDEVKEIKEEIHLPIKSALTVEEGATVRRGDILVDGFMDPHRVLEVRGLNAVQNYIVDQVQTVYRDQGVDINDKHIEVIVRQMLRKVKIVDSNDTDFLPGSTQDRLVVDDVNEAVEKSMVEDVDEDGNKYMRPGKGATYSLVLLGVTKASLATESFLSAASFQETTKVLTEAAISGKTDYLRGLKENVIIGKLIPAGTGMEEYRNVEVGLSRTAIPYSARNIRLETDDDLLPEDRDKEELIKGLNGDPIMDFGEYR
ncbi:hypothetical protein IJT17_06995, partial [bacterium]|nr:hypothetical protein [bacterium]